MSFSDFIRYWWHSASNLIWEKKLVIIKQQVYVNVKDLHIDIILSSELTEDPTESNQRLCGDEWRVGEGIQCLPEQSSAGDVG